jgi:hypothetical protein
MASNMADHLLILATILEDLLHLSNHMGHLIMVTTVITATMHHCMVLGQA